MKKRLSCLVLVLALSGVGCANSGEPDDYDANVQENFLEACTATGDDVIAADALADVCACAYDMFVETVPYADFKAFDDELRNDIGAPFPEEYQKIFADCIRASA